MNKLTSRERVIRTINHQEPDRVPLNIQLTVDIYHRLRAHLGLPPEPDRAAGVWTEVSASLDLLDAMQIDIITVGLNKPTRPRFTPPQDGLLYDEWGVGRRKVTRADGSYYYEMVSHPLAGATLEQVRDFPWPDPFDPARAAGLRDKVLRLRKDSDKALIGKFNYSIWEQGWSLYGLQAWMEDLALRPEVPCAIMDKLGEIAAGMIAVGLREVGDQIDILRLSGEDLGIQTGPMISPRMYARYVQPRFQKLWGGALAGLRALGSPAPLGIHSCGSVRAFLPSWIEMGLRFLDPIQPRAAGMEPDGLKRDFGEKLVFHGGIDLQHVLPFGSVEEVKAEVRRYIRALAPGGGYIVAPAHNVQSDVPPRNLVAVRDAVLEFGAYPIQ